MSTDRYDIIRYYKSDREPKLIRAAVSLSEAETHCHDAETSSKSASSPEAKRHTASFGEWFDGYTKRASY